MRTRGKPKTKVKRTRGKPTTQKPKVKRTRGKPIKKEEPKQISGLFNNPKEGCIHTVELDGNKYVDFDICEYSCREDCNNYFARRKKFRKIKTKIRGGE